MSDLDNFDLDLDLDLDNAKEELEEVKTSLNQLEKNQVSRKCQTPELSCRSAPF